MSSSEAATAATERGRLRRARIVDAAAELFDARGFHNTSIDDIGAAAGISGPGLYRHFASKDDLLTAVFDRIWERLRPAMVDAAACSDPEKALRLLIDAHVDLAVTDPADLRLLLRELRNVPADYQRLAARNYRRYLETWITPLRSHDPELGPDEARALALAAHGTIDATALRPGDLTEETRRRVSLRAALRVLALA